MAWRDKQVVFEGNRYRVVYNQDRVEKPFSVVRKDSGERVFSWETERGARHDVLHRDKRSPFDVG